MKCKTSIGVLQDYIEEDVTRHHFQFDVLQEDVRKDIEADAFWCMTKVGPNSNDIQTNDIW